MYLQDIVYFYYRGYLVNVGEKIYKFNKWKIFGSLNILKRIIILINFILCLYKD